MATLVAANSFFFLYNFLNFLVRKLLNFLGGKKSKIEKKRVRVGTNILIRLLDRKQTFFKGGPKMSIQLGAAESKENSGK